ncbi:hypothetical protein THAOC_06754 [Thalassiosira oceanica]|uniref:Uncharacterized protein n=1 Tax=Thalassiosira oceanica TaxID=159749 RepID=K0SZK7_THAOC|nr:hypothetical protein THAOC_06754 [Thalassiosira oceanica]|eukprot:EJK71773.1 hypothetical protein THAOC_06754 [Thalassiosira oceanica]
MEQNCKTDMLTGHYLGGRSFGPLLIAGTIFASIFSGYTVIGVPNESYRRGFYGFRWLTSSPYINYGFICTGVRLRKASLVRNYSTSVDFITDRFRSQLLRYTILAIQVMGSIIYVAAQVNALQSTFNSMFGIPIASAWPVICIFTIILAFEWAGGLAAVAMSDSIQGLVMVVSFCCIPFVILKNYGGWHNLDPITYAKPEFYQTPSKEDQWSFWQFSLINVCFFSLPHLVRAIERFLAAMMILTIRHLEDATIVRSPRPFFSKVGPWLASLPGVFIGTVGVQMLYDAGVENPPSPFTAIIEQLLSWGGFPEVVGIIALTASLAAIMSTADSLIIAISQLITVEVIWPLKPDASQSQLTWLARGSSFVAVVIALVTGILWKSGVSALTAINFPVVMQAVPAYINGLYGSTETQRLHPWSLAMGASAGIIYTFSFFFGYIFHNTEAKPVDTGITGVLLNVFVSVLAEFLVFDRSKFMQLVTRKKIKSDDDEKSPSIPVQTPVWDVPNTKRFGESNLTVSLLNAMMEGFPEPIRSPAYNAMFLLSVSIITPLIAEGQPVISEATNEWVSLPPTVLGIPWWFFKQILLSILPYAALLKIIWDMPNEYPFNEEKIDSSGMDPALLELTAQEMNFRSSYDAPNESIARRRSTLSSKLEAIGISKSQLDNAKTLREEHALEYIPKEQRLSSIIKQEAIEASGVAVKDESKEPQEMLQLKNFQPQ